MRLNFGHSKVELNFWRSLAEPLTGKEETPFYVFSIDPIRAALADLETSFAGLPLRQWLSFKTQPVRPLIQWWRQQKRGVEVVSEFEFLAALKEGFSPDLILVNGPAKHRWLSRHPIKNISVNFDSPAEAQALLPFAKKLHWRVGIRLNTAEEFDPEAPHIRTQFGFSKDEATSTLKKLRRAKIRLEMIHFHLRTNISTATVYENALKEVFDVCATADFQPRIIDCGGGFPVAHVLTRDGNPVDKDFNFGAMRRVYERILKQLPSVEEIWLENGRWLSARSGVLVVKILEIKQRGKMRNLICDGGRTMNAMPSTWEQHEIISIPKRSGVNVLTTVNGPTCMAFDQLARRPLPASLRAGDYLVWLDAGAYHVSWETRFSHGYPTALWHDGKRVQTARKRESFTQWWGQWQVKRINSTTD